MTYYGKFILIQSDKIPAAAIVAKNLKSVDSPT